MKRPPGPRGRQVFEFFRSEPPLRTLGFLERTARTYGSLSYFRLLHQHTFLVNDTDLIKEVLITQQHKFGRDVGATVLRELVGDGLITREEPKHRERRRILQPAFHREQIATYIQIISEECAHFLPAWRTGVPIDIGETMRRLTLSIIGSSLFGTEFRSSAQEISAILGRVMQQAGHIAPLITLLKPVTRMYRRFLPNGRSLFFEKERRALDEVLQPLIARRRKASGRDVLSLLMAQYDETEGAMSDEDIRNEIVTFVLAGHETTATALTWAFYLLAERPEMQSRIADEAVRVFAGRPPTFEEIPCLRFGGMVFTETMRLFPPVHLFGRRALEPVALAGFEVPRGATILLSPYITQRDERYYRNPDLFLPERWEGEGPPKFAWFPFGGGAKVCIGEPFARTEGVLILAEVLSRFKLFDEGNRDVQPNPRVTLVPNRPVMLRAELRDEQVTSARIA